MADSVQKEGGPAVELIKCRFHTAQNREFGGFLCGLRLYETMLARDTDPAMPDDEVGAAFADIWCAGAPR